jgi:predicted glutamine amidotransferase
MLALNFVLTDGNYLIGFRRNRSLHYGFVEGGTLVASESLSHEIKWHEVPENHFIVCTKPGEVRLAAYDLELRKTELQAI